MRCSVEGCDRSPDMVVAGLLLCGDHAAPYRCSVEGCECWADAALAGRLLCRHHLTEYRQTGRPPLRVSRKPAGESYPRMRASP